MPSASPSILVKNIPYRMATWTSINLNWFFFNDVYCMQLCNQSLIVNTTNDFRSAPPCVLSSTSDFAGLLGLNNFGTDYINQTGLVYYEIGPFLSIDALYIEIPSVVSAAHTAFQKYLFEQLADSHHWKTFLQLPTLTVNPTPPTWQGPGMLYYGGNLLCLYGAPQTYVQTMFSFYDNCDRQVPAELELSAPTLLFALAMTLAVAPAWNVSAICALQTSAFDCTAVLSSGISLLSKFLPMDTALLRAAHQSLLTLDLSLFQFATSGSQWTILTEALVNPASAHVFFGYGYVADWVIGSREAVSFEGDAGIFPLISSVYAPYAMSSAQSSLSTATSLILYSIYYSSAVFVAVALLCFGYGLVHWRHLDGATLWHFHRLVGAVWRSWC
ncbi:hypothetical protein SPRG_13348 [Saprolegnia parasitica CBS 223.65]|uniref:Uncharacterized protein n=1 Tax=Saprolegnia parasitica (strain CBS 223.65) TaxID=695850 RepID=A0A067BSN5_SAPPC|nr:hypothetical protein SPRG_13348 [Saprolegnia parasitica CBS 223.65]KDO21539.1 hypothetical protein SPRG_13348 [Saprolegnia parasitica CBS 223.65]|eukprot:XP_012207718.1 hypothetical protein SPRG_13348 [Saprolegnia parasitica CBS 223.65]